MKKITFILIALISGNAFAQNSASDEAQVFAEIVTPITIRATSDLNFGSIAADENIGNVRVSVDGVRTFSNTNMTIGATEGNVSAAVFQINAPIAYAYRITLTDAELILDGAPSMPVVFDHSSADDVATGNQHLRVGALLSVGANQPAGTYTGTAKVTVSYE